MGEWRQPMLEMLGNDAVSGHAMGCDVSFSPCF
ncbi:hypothetical protein EDC48_101386 [Gibbsiella quercinecans]|nr:hypothetical protein EDC48_101386 [Gibbsiella quercinecans]